MTSKNTKRGADAPRSDQLPYLTAADVAAIWTEERRRNEGNDAPAIKPATVVTYVKESLPMVGKKPGRYHDHPVPHTHRAGQRLLFVPGPGETLDYVRDELRLWYRNRPGRGAGGGRPRGWRKVS